MTPDIVVILAYQLNATVSHCSIELQNTVLSSKFSFVCIVWEQITKKENDG